MVFLIVTGLSGSGKSSCVRVLEDIGFFCIDNMPPQLIPNFAEMCANNREIERVAIVTDIRGGAMFLKLPDILNELRAINRVEVKILYLEASREVLMNRYNETRRKHPLEETAGGNLAKAIDAEETLLTEVRAKADYIIDSSLLTSRQLQEQVSGLFLEKPSDRMIVSCMSFGFMYGVPGEADLVFDVRCLPNPFYVPELKRLTGLDEEVRDYVMKSPQSKEFEKKILDMADFLMPLYVKEGKSRLVIAFGCTGGKHRSVTFAKRTAEHLEKSGYLVREIHRDVEK